MTRSTLHRVLQRLRQKQKVTKRTSPKRTSPASKRLKQHAAVADLTISPHEEKKKQTANDKTIDKLKIVAAAANTNQSSSPSSTVPTNSHHAQSFHAVPHPNVCRHNGQQYQPIPPPNPAWVKTRNRLEHATNDYNTAFRMSNEMYNHREMLQSLLSNVMAERLKNDDKAITLADREQHYRKQIDAMTLELDASEDDRKRVWFNVFSIKAEFDAFWHHLGATQPIPIVAEKPPVPALRSSTVLNMPPPIPDCNVGASSLAYYPYYHPAAVCNPSYLPSATSTAVMNPNPPSHHPVARTIECNNSTNAPHHPRVAFPVSHPRYEVQLPRPDLVNN